MAKPYAVRDSLKPIYELAIKEGTGDEEWERFIQEFHLNASSNVLTVRRRILAQLCLYRIQAARLHGARFILTRSEVLASR